MARLILGDPHLINEVNDRYNKTFNWIKNSISSFNMSSSIDRVSILGDVMDCEYITYRKLLYFYDFIELIKRTFEINDVEIIVGNHDKYSKTDSISNNLLRHIYYDGKVVSSIERFENILFVPHFYDKTQAEFSSDDINTTDIILAHIGSKDIFGDNELTVDYIKSLEGTEQHKIITGHVHNMNLNFEKEVYFIGSMKADSFSDSNIHFAVAYLNNEKELSFFIVPYTRMFLTFNVSSSEKLKKSLVKTFEEIDYMNRNYTKLDHEGIVSSVASNNSFLTSNISLKFRLMDDSIKKKDLDLIVEQCTRDVDSSDFMNIKIKTFIDISKIRFDGKKKEDPLIIISNQRIEEGRDKLKKYIVEMKENPLLNQRKAKKIFDSITDNELDLFVEYLISSKKEDQLDKLITFGKL